MHGIRLLKKHSALIPVKSYNGAGGGPTQRDLEGEKGLHG